MHWLHSATAKREQLNLGSLLGPSRGLLNTLGPSWDLLKYSWGLGGISRHLKEESWVISGLRGSSAQRKMDFEGCWEIFRRTKCGYMEPWAIFPWPPWATTERERQRGSNRERATGSEQQRASDREGATESKRERASDRVGATPPSSISRARTHAEPTCSSPQLLALDSLCVYTRLSAEKLSYPAAAILFSRIALMGRALEHRSLSRGVLCSTADASLRAHSKSTP